MAINPVQFPRFEIPLHKVLARLGYASGKTQLDAATESLISEEITAAQRLIVPRQVVSSSQINRTAPERIMLEPGFEIASRDIFKLLEQCVTAFGFAVTIGNNLEVRRNRYLEEKETTRGLILDAVGSVAAEELAEITHRQIIEESKRDGRTVTHRFSPGYGDWTVVGQKDFLAWLGADAIGIRLTTSFQMLPEKSVSAILGVR